VLEGNHRQHDAASDKPGRDSQRDRSIHRAIMSRHTRPSQGLPSSSRSRRNDRLTDGQDVTASATVGYRHLCRRYAIKRSVPDQTPSVQRPAASSS
jgi:hypothetical protein